MKDEVIYFYNTTKADRIRTTESFQDSVIRTAYEKGQSKRVKGDLLVNNHPVSAAMFDEMLFDKMPRLATCMSGVHTIGAAQTRILVIASPEMIGFLANHGYSLDRIDFLGIQHWQIDLALQQGLDKSQINLVQLKKGHTVKQAIEQHIRQSVAQAKYDGVVMNPPWELAEDFMQLARALTKPDATIGTIADAKSAHNLDWTRVAEFEYTANSFAGVQLNSIVVVEQKQPVAETLLRDMQGRAVSIDPAAIQIPPLVDLGEWERANSVVRQIRSGDLVGYEMVSEGTLHRREWESNQQKGGIETMATVGESNQPIQTQPIDPALQSRIGHIQDHLVVMGADYSVGAIGPVKYKGPGIGTCNRIHGIRVESQAEALAVIEHLNSAAVKRLVQAVKITAKNSKSLLAQIPTHHCHKKWMKQFDQ